MRHVISDDMKQIEVTLQYSVIFLQSMDISYTTGREYRRE